MYRRRVVYPKRENKFNNINTEYNGRVYDSRSEAGYARFLDVLLKSKQIVSWRPQVSFPLVVNGMKIATYICDFVIENTDHSIEYVDVKGFKKNGKPLTTDVYRLKKKLMKACHQIDLVERECPQDFR